jgi:hypothetical protein
MEIGQTIDEHKNKKILFLITKTRRVKKWTAMEDKLLMIIASNYGYCNWKSVSNHFPGRSAIQCSARYKRIKPGFHKGLWSLKEDTLLLKLIKLHGKDWSTISMIMGNRSGKQIRDRYLNTLNPELIKARFTEDEDALIQKLYMKYGSKWTTIARYIPGRSGDMIKNRFYSVLRNEQKLGKDTTLTFTKETDEMTCDCSPVNTKNNYQAETNLYEKTKQEICIGTNTRSLRGQVVRTEQ